VADFDTLESSRESSRPLELYTIAIGTDSFRYTSGEDEITIGLNTWEPIAIARSSLTQGPDERRRTITVTMPADNVFVNRYIDIVPGQKATISIIRLQRDESPTFNTQVLIFKGQIQSVRFPDDGNTAEIAIRSLEAAASRQIPRWTYMGMCNHVLYDSTSGCNANSLNPQFRLSGNVTAISGNILTVAGANARPDGWWAGGFIQPFGVPDFRVILAHTGNNLTLLLPFDEVIVGTPMFALAGCNHDIFGDCGTKFDRVIDYGGFAFIPFQNPFETPIA